MSNLRTFLKENGLRQAEFAERVGTTQGMISRLVSGVVVPSLDLAVRIERITDGAVPAASWIPKVDPIPPSNEAA